MKQKALCAICGECLVSKECNLEDDENTAMVKFSCPNCKADVLYLIPIENLCMLEKGSGK